MNTTAPPLKLQVLEKRREKELEEARAIQSVMLPAESLRAGERARIPAHRRSEWRLPGFTSC